MTVDSKEFYIALGRLERIACDLERISTSLKVIVDSQVQQREEQAIQKTRTDIIWWHVLALWGTTGGLITAITVFSVHHLTGGGKP